jgi:hypothetical protein
MLYICNTDVYPTDGLHMYLYRYDVLDIHLYAMVGGVSHGNTMYSEPCDLPMRITWFLQRVWLNILCSAS